MVSVKIQSHLSHKEAFCIHLKKLNMYFFLLKKYNFSLQNKICFLSEFSKIIFNEKENPLFANWDKQISFFYQYFPVIHIHSENYSFFKCRQNMLLRLKRKPWPNQTADLITSTLEGFVQSSAKQLNALACSGCSYRKFVFSLWQTATYQDKSMITSMSSIVVCVCRVFDVTTVPCSITITTSDTEGLLIPNSSKQSEIGTIMCKRLLEPFKMSNAILCSF